VEHFAARFVGAFVGVGAEEVGNGNGTSGNGVRKSDPRKLAVAELFWKETTVSQEWIAEKLSMRSAANVSQQLRRLDREKTLGKLPPEVRSFLLRAWERGL